MQTNASTTVWAAFLMSQLVFAGTSWLIWDAQAPANPIVVWTMVGMVAPLTLMSTFGANFLAKGDEAWFTRAILRWAFAEAVAIFGIVTAVSGGPRWLGPVLAAWGFLLVLIAFPRREA